MQRLIIKFHKMIEEKIVNSNLTNLEKFWHQTNGLGEMRKISRRLQKNN